MPHTESFQEWIDDGIVVNLNEVQLPRTLLHYEVVMAIMLPDGEMMLPRRHIVILHNQNKPESRAYSTHDVAYQPGWAGGDSPWVLAWGHYDKDCESAVDDMLKRAGYRKQ